MFYDILNFFAQCLWMFPCYEYIRRRVFLRKNEKYMHIRKYVKYNKQLWNTITGLLNLYAVTAR